MRYLVRNPKAPAPPQAVAPKGDYDIGRVYPVSRTLERFNDVANVNRVTAGCGLGIYRDTLLGEAYYGNAFTCEPVHNLVTRMILSGDETVTRTRAADEKESEFLASTDNWSRPVQARTGPDGALYVVDMYRFLIEHPRWIPAERLAKLDVRAGAGMGRIYRVKPNGQAAARRARSDEAERPGIRRALDTPNGTERDRVHQLLLLRHDEARDGGARAACDEVSAPAGASSGLVHAGRRGSFTGRCDQNGTQGCGRARAADGIAAGGENFCRRGGCCLGVGR